MHYEKKKEKQLGFSQHNFIDPLRKTQAIKK